MHFNKAKTYDNIWNKANSKQKEKKCIQKILITIGYMY